ncbi:thioredoxin family protein [Shewanella sp. GXUN23E]|uniref:thioredoxin family protein n=1 Tax=Shewanella sp. GXUN23E TaxID=3422498 RepID=UPI003D7E36C5
MTIMIWAMVLVLLLLLVWLGWQKYRGRLIPWSVFMLLGLMTFVSAGIANFVTRGEDYRAWEQLHWQPLATEQIPLLVAQGKTVVVDITADWCAVCQRNKAEVLHREAVVRALSDDNIVLMRAEMSAPHPQAEAYLARERAFGVPFNRIYGPAMPAGVTLPRELTLSGFLTALENAMIQ